MGRPKLYKTQEERVLAARTYRMKYYQRSDVTTHATTTHSTTEIPLQSNLDELDEQPIRDADSPHLDDASSNLEELNPIEKIDKSLKQVTGTSFRSLMDTLCQEYIRSGDYVPIWNVLHEVEGLETQYWDGSSDDPTEIIFNRVHASYSFRERRSIERDPSFRIYQSYFSEPVSHFPSLCIVTLLLQSPVLFKDWCARWPERTITFPELPVDTPLTSEQEETLAQALSKRRENISGLRELIKKKFQEESQEIREEVIKDDDILEEEEAHLELDAESRQSHDRHLPPLATSNNAVQH
ncbi:hypothetical protein EDC04DRAFT_2601571 [Pisolithus marmoratus]|nr:hypothetical protein EDC04DRAFT_2601571 [Pisolithus marmoratus]